MNRGEYRSIHTVIVDGPDYQALTPSAKLVLLTLKLTLGPSGIDVVPALRAVLAERTGLTEDAVGDALRELGEPRPDDGRPWVRVERNVVWLVDGLRHEPKLSPTNEGHRRGIQQHLAGLPHLAIVDAFRTYYAEWMALTRWTPAGSDPDTLPTAPDSPADAIAMASDSQPEHTPRGKEGKREQGARIAPRTRRAAEEEEPPGFAAAWAAYPQRAGANPRREALRAYRARLREGVTPDELLAGVQRYARYCAAMGKVGTEYVAQAATFFGPSERFREAWAVPEAAGVPPTRRGGTAASPDDATAVADAFLALCERYGLTHFTPGMHAAYQEDLAKAERDPAVATPVSFRAAVFDVNPARLDPGKPRRLRVLEVRDRLAQRAGGATFAAVGLAPPDADVAPGTVEAWAA